MSSIRITGADARQPMLLEKQINAHVSTKIPKPSKLSVTECEGGPRHLFAKIRADGPLLPNTGPGSARSAVSQNAMPSPYRCVDSPEICAPREGGVVSRRAERPEAEQTAHLELDFDDEIGGRQRETRPEPSLMSSVPF